MASISPEQAASDLLTACLAGTPWPGPALERLLQPDGHRLLFSVVVEGLADLFEPRLCDVYARLFSEVLSRTVPGLDAQTLFERYLRVRHPRKFEGDPEAIKNVFVLSRVTLGADVAVTSIVLNGAKQRFPNATVYFAGPRKSWELFAADSALEHLAVSYERAGSMADRLAAWPALREALSAPDSIVIDPDSRLTQLGLLPVCPDDAYYFLESRSYGSESELSLGELTSRWMAETFAVEDARPYIAPLPAAGEPADVTVSFGTGENTAKRVADPFECELLQRLAEREPSVLVDRGAGGEEAERVDRAVGICGPRVRMWDGSFATFAAHIARSRLYVGYDSAGGHVAAAAGIPLIGIFAGAPCERFFHRWRPRGTQVHVVRPSTPALTLEEVTRAVDANDKVSDPSY